MTNQHIKGLTLEAIEKMTKTELKEHLIAAVTIMNTPKEQKSHRKFEVLNILIEHGPISILDISNHMDTTTNNVSTLLQYLKRDGHTIHTDEYGNKFLVRS